MELGFYSTGLPGTDATLITFTMDIGLIPTEYATTEYFNDVVKGALALLPTTTDTDLSLQFLYQIQQQYSLSEESYAILTPQMVLMIGAN